MSSFLNVILTMELAVANTTLSTTPIGDVPAPITLAATTVYYNPAFQVAASPTAIPIPPPATNGAQIVYLKNLDDTNLVTLTYTPEPFGSSPTPIQIPPGGVFLYFNPGAGMPGGISALSVEAATSTVNVEVFIGY